MRPGFTCTAEITTATRQQALSVPIQAMTVREMIVDSEGQIVKPAVVPGSRAAADANTGDQPLEPGQTRKEIEGVFVIRDGKAQFTPVKTGIAGEKYFEALSGLKAGRSGHHRALRLGSQPEGRRRRQDHDDAGRLGRLEHDLMYQFVEAASIALQAIWTNKLRSFLMVIGNVVAVTSIIAVVSLVQGLNAEVSDAIQSQFPPDAFSVQRRGLTRTEDEADRAASNPRVTLADAQAIREFGPTIGMVMAEIGTSAQVKYHSETIDS